MSESVPSVSRAAAVTGQPSVQPDSRIDAGHHEGDVDRLAMGLASMEHVVHTHRDSGVDAALPSAVADLFRRGMEAGHAADSFSSIVELLGKGAPGGQVTLR
ncbi:hypothetical protein [Streptomyces sp. NPDC048436]|uniref:imine reductase family protein n=1 Tax=Streptomyces sp. NPDC048436 TaxID=3365550 RepID=UPI00371A4ED1